MIIQPDASFKRHLLNLVTASRYFGVLYIVTVSSLVRGQVKEAGLSPQLHLEQDTLVEVSREEQATQMSTSSPVTESNVPLPNNTSPGPQDNTSPVFQDQQGLPLPPDASGSKGVPGQPSRRESPMEKGQPSSPPVISPENTNKNKAKNPRESLGPKSNNKKTKKTKKTHSWDNREKPIFTAELRYQAGVQGTQLSGYGPKLGLYQEGVVEPSSVKTTIKRPRPPIQGIVDLGLWPKNPLSSWLSLDLGSADKARIVQRAFLKGVLAVSKDSGIDIHLGRDRLILGGFENETPYAVGHPLSTYQEYRLPYRDQRDTRSVDGILLATKSPVGEWSLQVMRDVSDTVYKNSLKSFSHKYQNDSRQSGKGQKPAFALEIKYPFTLTQRLSVTPLLQGGSYDGLQSRYVGGGLKVRWGQWTQTLDGAIDRRAVGRDEDSQEEWGSSMAEVTTLSKPLEYLSIRFFTWETRLDTSSGLSPFVKISQFLTEQGINRETEVLNARGNQSIDSFDDQALDFFTGFQWKLPHVQPFAWVHVQRQKLLIEPRDPYKSQVVTARSIELGLSGVIK